MGFGPSKPEKPPPLSQDDSAQLEEDEEADVQAAIQESLKAPTSPQVQSGSQSSTLKPMLDLDQQESDLMTQLDKLMAETLRLETMTNLSVRDSSRMRTIEGVTQGIVKQLEEIAQQRSKSSPPALSSQTSKVQSAIPIAAPPVSRPEAPSAQVRAVSPHKSKPLTPTPPKERSHRRRRHSPSPVRDRTPEERRRSPTSSKERPHDKRRRSPTPSHDRVSEERKPSPPPSREPSRERRRRRRSPEHSVIQEI